MSTCKLLRFAGFIALQLSLPLSLLTAKDDSNDPKELVMGIISTEASSQLRKGFDPFIEELSRKLDMPIKPHFATDYAGVIEAMRFNKVHLAWVGNKSGIEAVDRANAEVIAQITKADGNNGYNSVIIVNKGSPLQSIDDILANSSNLVFGNGDPNSTSGSLIPSFYLWAPHNIDPQTSFKLTRNANHEVNCLSVAMGQVDFATANTEALARFAIARPKLAERLQVIWTSPKIPNDPLVIRRDLSDEIKSKIKGVLLSFGRVGPTKEKELELLAGIQDGWGPFIASDNAQLLPIRKIAIQKEIQTLSNRDNVSEADKETRLAKLEYQKAELIRLAEYARVLQEGMDASDR